jgi:transposase
MIIQSIVILSKLYIREWTCPSCKTKLDRDLNASKNILKEGIKISSGTDDYRCGDEIRPVKTGKVGEASKKKELVSRNLSVFIR